MPPESPPKARVAGKASSPAQFTDALHDAPEGSRHYKLFVPAGRRRGKPSLLVMLHGCHQDAAEFSLATRMNEHAQLHGFLVAYPEQASAANGAKCWNWYEAAHQRREQGEPAIIAGLTRQLVSTHGVAANQTFIAGFSAGGAMAATLAVMYPELYAALGIHSGVPHGAARDFMSAMIAMQHGVYASYAVHPLHAQIPTIVFHGDEDTTVHSTHAAQFLGKAPSAFAPASEQRFVERIAANARQHGYTRTVQFDAQQNPFSEHWMVHGGGHVWYGGDASKNYTDDRGPDASAEMARFFVARALSDPTF